MIQNYEETHLIFGALGQDGSYLSENLSREGKNVFGVVRKSAKTIQKYQGNNIQYIRGDILDASFINYVIKLTKPTHVYNLAAMSSVKDTLSNPSLSQKVNFEFVQSLIQCIENHNQLTHHKTYFLQASSSEMFGPDQLNPLHEKSDHDPRSPYAQHKSLAHKYCLDIQDSKQVQVGILILFNHESSRRPLKYVSRKITNTAYLISKGLQNKLILGNLEITRDWGYAPDYVKVMQIMGRESIAEDFVVATGQTHSLTELCALAFEAFDITNYEKFIYSDKSLFRENESSGLTGDASKLTKKISWKPSITFQDMIKNMALAETVQAYD